MSDDGLVKFTEEHTTTPATEVPHWAELNDARTQLHKLGLLGLDSHGVGFGNLSIRVHENEFLITGTATGSLPTLTPSQYCLVKSFNFFENRIVSMGPIQASSESMTHGAVYDSRPEINCVMHIHSRSIFDKMTRTGYFATPEDAAYGTPELAMAIEKCVDETNKDQGAIVLAGHDEGIIVFGSTVETALNLVLDLQKKYGV